MLTPSSSALVRGATRASRAKIAMPDTPVPFKEFIWVSANRATVTVIPTNVILTLVSAG